MNLYIAFSEKSKIKKCFLNLRKYLIISTQDVIESAGYQNKVLDDCSTFLVNEEIKKMIKEGSTRRKLLSIVYTNPNINDQAVREMIHFATALSTISKVILLVEKGEKEEYYELFDEILFYPTMKKVHIIECAPFVFAKADLKSQEMDGNDFFT